MSGKGVIRAKKAGIVSITVKSGNITKRCVLVVKKGKNKYIVKSEYIAKVGAGRKALE